MDFHKTRYMNIFRKSVEKIQVSLKSDRNNGYFVWRPMYIYDSISLLIMRNVSDEICRANQNTHFTFNSFFFFFFNRADYEICWNYGTAWEGTDDTTVGLMRIARWISKATDTRS